MAGVKRKIETFKILNRPELLYELNKMERLRDKALAAFLYLSGCRISEVLGCKKKMPDGTIQVIEPLRKESIEILPDEDLIVIHNVPCLKRRNECPRRNIPVIPSQEPGFIQLFLAWHSTLKPGARLFKINRQRAWQILNQRMGIYNHFLVHERCTHLVVNKNFTDVDLKQFRGWKTTNVAAVYTHLNYRDIANKMR